MFEVKIMRKEKKEKTHGGCRSTWCADPCELLYLCAHQNPIKIRLGVIRCELTVYPALEKEKRADIDRRIVRRRCGGHIGSHENTFAGEGVVSEAEHAYMPRARGVWVRWGRKRRKEMRDCIYTCHFAPVPKSRGDVTGRFRAGQISTEVLRLRIRMLHGSPISVSLYLYPAALQYLLHLPLCFWARTCTKTFPCKRGTWGSARRYAPLPLVPHPRSLEQNSKYMTPPPTLVRVWPPSLSTNRTDLCPDLQHHPSKAAQFHLFKFLTHKITPYAWRGVDKPHDTTVHIEIPLLLHS